MQLRPDSLLSDDLSLLLIKGCKDLGINLSEHQVQNIAKFLVDLQKWNKAFNLTAVRNPRDMIINHILDSFSLNKYISGNTILDVGSGAGLPGLPLAIANPNKKFTLIDSSGKKTRFIHHVKTNLLLENVTVINSRVENLNNKVVFDHIISRAFSSVARFLELTQHLLKHQGSLLAMKGNISKNEISEIPKSWKFIKQHDVHIPMMFKRRTILELKIMEEKFGSNYFNS